MRVNGSSVHLQQKMRAVPVWEEVGRKEGTLSPQVRQTFDAGDWLTLAYWSCSPVLAQSRLVPESSRPTLHQLSKDSD